MSDGSHVWWMRHSFLMGLNPKQEHTPSHRAEHSVRDTELSVAKRLVVDTLLSSVEYTVYLWLLTSAVVRAEKAINRQVKIVMNFIFSWYKNQSAIIKLSFYHNFSSQETSSSQSSLTVISWGQTEIGSLKWSTDLLTISSLRITPFYIYLSLTYFYNFCLLLLSHSIRLRRHIIYEIIRNVFEPMESTCILHNEIVIELDHIQLIIYSHFSCHAVYVYR
jgi:hypothetical protein